MKFCPDCNNFLYITEGTTKDDEKNVLINTCRNCGYEEKREDNKIDTLKFDYETSYKNLVPDEIVSDLTYPRTRAIKCPNADCDCNVDPKVLREVLFFRQKSSLKLTYVCSICKTMWKD
jgi:DNA-directed RNA polymerase subunit M/transcription elongation factor TFIIS